MNGQVTTNSGSGLAATYGSLSAAITALNAATISSPVVITLTGNETAPLGGFSITATGTSSNTITIEGSSSTITAPTSQTSGILTDAIFKIIGGDYITIQNFTMNENASNTTTAAGTNNMTEFGVALFYATTTNGAQNCTIKNNTITLNRTYQNTIGIYSNSTHSATVATTSASATTTTGGNSGLKIQSNTISNINQGIVIVGPTAAADANTGIEIGGTAGTANTISNYGTTGTFSAYANVSGTVNGILVRNSNGFTISHNMVTSSVGGVTTGTLNGIQIPAASATPTTTFTNNINNNSISLKSGLIAGAMNGITYPSGSASATSVLNINNNDFNNTTHTVSGTAAIIFISTASTNLTTSISNNTFTNISCNTTGSVTFISQSFTAPSTGTKIVNNNSIVTAFSKTGAGGTVIFITDNGSTVSGAVSNCTNNNFSNVTLTGATAITGINYTDGGTAPTRTVTGNILNNWTTGAAAINTMNFTYWNGVSSLSTNTITNITGQSSVTGITIGSTANTANPLNVSNNTINNLSSTGTGGNVTGITCANTSAVVSLFSNTINNLSSSAASGIVIGIAITGAGANTSVYQNTIHTLSSSGATSPLVSGIAVSGGTTVNVYRNKVYGLNVSAAVATTSPAINGILMSGGTTVNAYNNLIGNLTAPSANLTDAIRGISLISTTASTSQNVYNNSIYLNASSTGANFGTSGIYHTTSTTSTTGTLDLRNNIILNNSTATGTGIAAAYRRSAGAATNLINYSVNSDNNMFYAGTPSSLSMIYTDGTAFAQTFTSYKTGVFTAGTIAPRDQASFTESSFNPATYFVSTTGSSADFLKPTAGLTSQAESGSKTVGGLFTTDYNGVTRGSNYDVGAWEFAGVSPAPSFSNMIATPAVTSSCVSVSRSINIDVVPSAGTLTSVTLNYSHNGSAQTPIIMTNTSGTTYNGVMSAPSTSNAIVTWNIVATNSIGLSTTYTGTSYQDDPNNGLTASATATYTTACIGSPDTLKAIVTKNGSIALGSGASTSSSNGTSMFTGAWGGNKTQYLIKASELTAIGLSAGNISALGFEPTTSGQAYAGFNVFIGTTSLTTLVAPMTSTASHTQVYLGTGGTVNSFTPTAGVLNNLIFGTGGTSSSFYWDGISNLLVTFCWSSNPTNSTSTGTTVKVDAVSGYTCGLGGQSDNLLPSAFCALTTGFGSSGTGTSRPKFTFTGVVAQTVSSHKWHDGTSVVSTSNPYTFSVPNTTSIGYVDSMTVNGCPLVTGLVTISTNPLPTAPTATPSTQCGAGIPAAAVADPNSFSSPTFKWYSAASGGTLLQTNVSTTFLTSISTTTTFHVSVINPSTGCESARTPITVTVNAPDSLIVTAPTAVCLGQNVALTAVNGVGTPTVTYTTWTWSSTPATGSGIPTTTTGSAVTVSPTAIGTYVYNINATDGSCTINKTISVIVNDTPTITSIIANPTAACVGSKISLSAASIGLGVDSSTIGTQTTTEFEGVYRHGAGNGDFRHQLLFTAAEMIANGFYTGNISALSFYITTLGSTTGYSNYSIKMANVTTAPPLAIAGGFMSPITPFTVYSATSMTPVLGENKYNFSTPFPWDGTSNILVEICYTVAGASTSSTVAATTPSGGVSHFNLKASVGACSNPTPNATVVNRPLVLFKGIKSTNLTNTYNWTWSPTADSNKAVTTATLPTGATTNYVVTATKASTGCFSSASASVSSSVPALALSGITASRGTTFCADIKKDTLTPNVTGGCIPYTYLWSNGSTNRLLIDTPAAGAPTYSVTVTDNSGATVSSSISLTINPLPTASISPTTASVCGTVAAKLDVVSATATGYSWSVTNSSAVTGLYNDAAATSAYTAGTSSSFVYSKPTGTTSYNVTVTDNNGCSITATRSVSLYNALTTVKSTDNNILCAGGSAQLMDSPSMSMGITAYAFVSSTGASLDPMTGATTIMSSGIDNTASAVTTFSGGFVFPYDGVNYTQFTLSDNGVFKLGSTAVSTTQYGSITGSAALLSPFGCDMGTGGNGGISYVMNGSAPNRIFVVDYKTTHTWSTSVNYNNNYQLWLYENGKIEYRYGAMGSTGTPSNGIGMSGTSTTNYISVATSTNSVSTSAVTTNTIVPASGTMYSFTPSVPNFTYSWTQSNTGGNAAIYSATNIYNPMISGFVTTDSFYALVTETTSGCSKLDTIIINLSTGSPTISNVASSNGTSFCVGQSTTLTPTFNGGCGPYTYSWDTDPNLPMGAMPLSTAPTFSVTPTATTTYYLTVTDNLGLSVTNGGIAGAGTTITINNPTPTAIPDTKCGTSSIFTLGALKGNVNDSLFWYAAANGGTSLGTGTSFTTPSLTSTTNYYVEEREGITAGLGNLTIPSATGASSERGIVFKATSSFKLISAQYYSPTLNVTNNLTVRLLDSATGTVITTKALSIAQGATAGWYTMNLDFSITPGTYRLLTGFSQSVNRISTGFTGYPMALSTLGSIVTGYNSGVASAEYNYFHNLTIQTGCTGARVPVSATLNTPPTITSSASPASVCSGSSTSINVTSSNAGYNYTWNSGALSGSSHTVTPVSSSSTAPATVNYTVTATDVSTGCVASAIVPVNVNPIPLISSTATLATVHCSNSKNKMVVNQPIYSPKDYGFTVGTTTYSAITGTNATGAEGVDDAVQQNIPIGFTFNYNGQSFSQISASSNGFISLVNSSTSGATNALATTANVIAPLWDDNNTTGATVIYSTSGTSPNQIFTIQWTGLHIAGGGSSTNPTLDMQASLYENGNIEFVYGSSSATLSSPTASIGISGASGNYKSVTLASPASNSTVSSTAEKTNNALTPISGTVFTFVKPTNPTLAWSPTSGLFTNSATTTSYSGTTATTNDTMYSVNTTSTLYTVTLTNSYGCINDTTILDSVNIPSTLIGLNTASVSGATSQCTDGSGFTYYADPTKPGILLFAINKGTTGMTGETISIEVLGTGPTSTGSSGVNYEHGSYLMKRGWDVTGTVPTGDSVTIRYFYDAADSSAVEAARDAAYTTLLGSNSSTLAVKTPFQWFKSAGVPYNAAWRSGISGNKFPSSHVKLTPSSFGVMNGYSYVEFNNIKSFSGGSGGVGYGAPGAGGGVGLPVTWASFDVKALETGNRLTWSTASEQNTDYFQVEYSYNGSDFTTVPAKIKAAGNSNILTEYASNHTDFNTFVYYRIKQVDLDGRTDYSVIKSVKRTVQPTFTVEVYPIPLDAKKELNLKLSAIDMSQLFIKMTDITGKVMVTKSIAPNSSNYSDKIDMSNMASGIYFVEVKNAQGKEVIKVLK